jgi:uncharacterized protein YecE (DUF72 family)
VFTAVEITSSFYREHRDSTYRRWASAVPPSFRFAVKLPRAITHTAPLRPSPLFEEFLAGPLALGARLGPLLVQFPPRLALDVDRAAAFFAALRRRFAGTAVCEPRHPSWFTPDAAALLEEFEIGRVAADPPPVPDAVQPGGWRGVTYFRLHGSPETYRSSYSEAFLSELVGRLRREPAGRPVWCVFDNTARGAAVANALSVLRVLWP